MSQIWQLANAEARAARDPETFSIPSTRERYSLSVGDDAKLIFEVLPDPLSGNTGERMWVRIESVETPGRYVGKLMNHPVVVTSLSHGAKVVFGAEHVADIDRDEDTQ